MPTEGRFQPEGDFTEALNQVLAPKLVRLGESESANVRQDISVPVVRYAGRVNRSLPGEPPRRDTGRLHSNVHHRIVKQTNGVVMLEIFAIRPGGNPKVPHWLERGTKKMAKRPFMARALARLSQSAPGAIGGEQ